MKYFGIGLEQTGTASLTAAMRMLGYKSVHLPSTMLEIEQNDFANDITVSHRFEILDRLFPGSKFIATAREEKAWLDSCQQWYGSRIGKPVPPGASVEFEALVDLYGQTDFDREVWRDGRREFHSRVLSHFFTRMQDLLILDIYGGDGWNKLLPFLQPNFPKENVFSLDQVEVA